GGVVPVVLLDRDHVVTGFAAGLLVGGELGQVLAWLLGPDVVELDVGAVRVLHVLLELVDDLVRRRVRPVADGERSLGRNRSLDLVVGHVLVDDRDVLRAGCRAAGGGTAGGAAYGARGRRACAASGARGRGASSARTCACDYEDGTGERADGPQPAPPQSIVHQTNPPLGAAGPSAGHAPNVAVIRLRMPSITSTVTGRASAIVYGWSAWRTYQASR